MMINILVVEDNVELNQIVCDYLRKSGYEVKGCLNPNEAYDAMSATIDEEEIPLTVREFNILIKHNLW